MHLRDTRVFSELLENLLADGLVYTQEDVDASRDFVMLTPCTTEADGAVSLSKSVTSDSEMLEQINATTSTAVYDVVLTNLSYYGSHTDSDDSSVYYCLADISRDIFPISEALALKPVKFTASASEASKARAPSFESLPLDINIYQEISAYLPPCGLVALTAIKKPPRALLDPRMDSFFFHYIVANEPHLFPAEEIECYGGNEEFDWWDESWRKGGLEADDPIPWMAYARACATSASMRNRKRISGIVGQMGTIARSAGLFDEACMPEAL
ncbi:hypothetical protein DFH09DRAFT_1365790 [Mycena vulgaris]|nr:hypothetical protein DFH09DRAFT_1365790 [Mycena vulgaris]